MTFQKNKQKKTLSFYWPLSFFVWMNKISNSPKIKWKLNKLKNENNNAAMATIFQA